MAQSQWGIAPYTIINLTGEVAHIMVSGRTRWALECLMAAKSKGCTPIDDPAPRWSAYVHDLRNEGVDIETIHEPHGGAFAGTHGRYVLRSRVHRGLVEVAE